VPSAYLAVLGQVERGDLLRLLDLLLVAPDLALQLVDQGLDRHGRMRRRMNLGIPNIVRGGGGKGAFEEGGDSFVERKGFPSKKIVLNIVVQIC
jgi:hypothetical protein